MSSNVLVSRAMIPGVITVAPSQPMSDVVQRMLAGFQDDLPVVEDGALVGVVGRAEVLRISARWLSSAMQRSTRLSTSC